MEVIPEKPHHRKTFYLIVGLALVLIVIVRFFVLPAPRDDTYSTALTMAAAVLDALFATGLATVAIASLLFWLSPTVMKRSRIDVIEPREIRPYLDQGRDGAREWWYRGGCGRFTRAVTIPSLARQARDRNVTKLVKIQILDPTNARTCRAYAEHRNRLRSGKNTRWTAETVREDLLATIVGAYTWRVEEPLLELEIGLHTAFSLLRIDLSDKLAVVTREDPLEPALTCEAKSFFYESFLEDLRLTLGQSRKLPQNVNGIPRNGLNAAAVRPFLQDLGLSFDPPLDERAIARVITLVMEAKNPYGG